MKLHLGGVALSTRMYARHRQALAFYAVDGGMAAGVCRWRPVCREIDKYADQRIL